MDTNGPRYPTPATGYMIPAIAVTEPVHVPPRGSHGRICNCAVFRLAVMHEGRRVAVYAVKVAAEP